MELLLIAIYVALCYAIFKVFRIPVNQWTLATAAFGGIVGLSLLILVMNYNHPYTKQARIYFTVTPIMAGVKGRVTDVPVAANVPLKPGDVLFRLDPHPYDYMVEQRKAAVAEAEQGVQELRSSFDKAVADSERAQSQLLLAQENYEREATLFKKQVVAKAALDTYTRNVQTATHSVEAAKAAEEHARLAYMSQVGGVNTTVAQLQAQLNDAQFDLDQTVMRAPTAGFVTQVGLRPGMYVVPAPLRPVMVFVNTGKGDQALVAAFQQNYLQRVKAGDHAEIAFDAVPGRIFKGKVKAVVNAIAAGQLQATGVLVDFGLSDASDRALAIIEVVDDISSYQIPLGAGAQVAVLTEHWHHVALLRRILLRIKSWQNYVFSEGHGGGGGGH